MPNDKTPLQKIQDETADYLDPWNMPAITRAALDAFLVQAFDAGVAAARELDAEVAKSEQQVRADLCTCPAKPAGYGHSLGLHTEACALNQPEQAQLSGRLSVSDPVPDWNPFPKN